MYVCWANYDIMHPGTNGRALIIFLSSILEIIDGKNIIALGNAASRKSWKTHPNLKKTRYIEDRYEDIIC
jgi:hypothetical protein